MAVYSKDGTMLASVYGADGTQLTKAYSADGTEIYSAQTFSVLGDSYSTFTGDVYPATNNIWYDGTKNGVTNKSMMWYRLFESASEIALDRNASYSGSPICYDGWGDGTDDAKYTCFVARVGDVADSTYIFVFGGTNDSWIGVSLGEFKYANWTETDMLSFRPALAKLLSILTTNHPNSSIIFIKNTGLGTNYASSIDTICEHYSVPVIALSNITKSDGHPTNVGMEQIAAQVATYIESIGE